MCSPGLRVQQAAFCSPGPRFGLLVLHGQERVAANEPARPLSSWYCRCETHPFSIAKQSQVSPKNQELLPTDRSALELSGALISMGDNHHNYTLNLEHNYTLSTTTLWEGIL